MNVFRNNRGVTLAELMVASGISILLTSIATFAFSMAMEVFVRTARLMEAETEMLSAMYAVKSVFAQSVNVVYGGNTNTSMGISGTPNTIPNSYNARNEAAVASTPQNATLGKLYSTNFNSTATTSTPNTFLLGLMLRELNTGSDRTGANAPNSLFYGTGVYFQRPGFNKSGALYIDQENNSSASATGGWVILSPINATNVFTRFTEFHIENISVLHPTDSTISIVDTGSPATYMGRTVLSADVRMLMRYFSKGDQRNWRWCPKDNMPGGGGATTAGCNDVTRRPLYTDIEKKVKVVFTNNSYDRRKYLAERPMGSVYFFKSWTPTTRKGL